MNAAVTIQATPRELCAGEKAQIDASVSGAPPNLMSYAWTVNGSAVGQGSSLTFDSTDRAPGDYQIGITVGGNGINPPRKHHRYCPRVCGSHGHGAGQPGSDPGRRKVDVDV